MSAKSGAKAPSAQRLSATAPSVSAPSAPAAAPSAVGDPTFPVWSDTFILSNSSVGEREAYVKEMAVSVAAHLHASSVLTPALGGTILKGKLHEQAPLDAAQSQRSSTVKSFKEAWRAEICKISLDASGVYDAAGNAFWLTTAAAKWDGESFPASEISWAQIAAGQAVWRKEK